MSCLSAHPRPETAFFRFTKISFRIVGQHERAERFGETDETVEKCSTVSVAECHSTTVSFTCFFRSRGNVVTCRLFSSSMMRRTVTQPPLTTFTEDEEVMKESGMSQVLLRAG